MSTPKGDYLVEWRATPAQGWVLQAERAAYADAERAADALVARWGGEARVINWHVIDYFQ